MRLMKEAVKKEYLTFVDDRELFPTEREIELTIKDITPGPLKYDAYNVRAIIFEPQNQVHDADILWLRSRTGHLFPEPYSIKIITWLDEYVHKSPYSKLNYIRF